MDDLVAFLRARFDEDERIARAAEGTELAPWLDLYEATLNAAGHPEDERRAIGMHIAHFSPGRALWEVVGKSRILDEHRPYSETERECVGCGLAGDTLPAVPDVEDCLVLRGLAMAYNRHQDYRREWAVPYAPDPDGRPSDG